MKRFSDIVNREQEESETVRKSTISRFRICKMDSKNRRVFGFAIKGTDNDIGNSEGYLIDGKDMELAIYEFMRTLPPSVPDQPVKVIESCVFTREKQQALGIPSDLLPPFTYWIGIEIHDQGIWQMIQKSDFPALTIEITGNE